jgi:hypothetical protein
MKKQCVICDNSTLRLTKVYDTEFIVCSKCKKKYVITVTQSDGSEIAFTLRGKPIPYGVWEGRSME